jgi:TP901 family phage tail tape measure protein
VLEKLGLGAIVKFDGDQAIAGMGKVGAAAGKMATQVIGAGESAGRGMQAFGGAITGAGLAMAPLTAAMLTGSRTAAEFEQQISALAAVAGATPAQMELLKRKAKEMGAATQFTATDSAKAMEELARAGFTVQETLDGIGGVMAAAASDAIPLETSAAILSSTLRGMGLEASKTERVADVLSKASAITNTNIIEMGEAMKFAAPVAKTMGMSLTDTVSAIGAMADIGIKGTLAGTALKNAMLQLASPTTAGQAAMDQLGGSLKTTKDGSIDLFGTFATLEKGLGKISDKTQQAALLNEIFGLRGSPAFTAWQNAVARAEEGGNKFTNMQKELNKQFTVGGAAAEMAKTRMDNVLGAFEQLSSAAEGFQIEFFESFQGGGKETLLAMAGFLSDVVNTMRLLNEGAEDTNENFSKIGSTARSVGTGIMDGIHFIQGGIKMLKDEFSALFGGIGDQEMVSNFAKWATVIGLIGGALAPVLVAVGGLVFLLGTALTSAFGAVSVTGLAVFGGIIFAINALRGNGESLMEAFFRVFNGIKDLAVDIFNNTLMPLFDGFMEGAGDSFSMIGDSFKILFGTIVKSVKALLPIWKGIFTAIGFIAGTVFKVVGAVFSGVMLLISAVIDSGVEAMRSLSSIFVKFVQGVADIIEFFGGGDILANSGFVASLAEFAAGREKEKTEFGSTDAFKSRFGDGAAEMMTEAETFGARPVAPGEATLVQDDSDAFKGVVEDIAASASHSSVMQGQGVMKANVVVEDKRTLDVHSCVNVDGRHLAAATSRNQVEVNERRGFKDSPWQRRVILEQGATALVTPG